MSNQFIKQANELLRTELDSIWPGPNPAHGKFQLKWSETLRSIIPVFENKGDEVIEPVYDYYCDCGRNINVHTPDCAQLTVARVRMQLISTFGPGGENPSYHKVWVLCRWVAPPSMWEWCDAGGTDKDYPEEGRYIPCSKGGIHVVIPPRASDSEILDGARLIIKMMRESFTETPKILAKEAEYNRKRKFPIFDAMGREIIPADPGVPYWRIKDRIYDKLMLRDPDATVGYTKELGAAPDAPA